MQWWELARSQHGAITRQQLAAAGVAAGTVTRMAERGEIVRVCHGVFRAGGAPESFRSRLWTGVLATEGTVAYQTAARLWGVVADEVEQIHLVLPHERRVSTPAGVRLHRVPVPSTEVTLRSGLPMTRRSWTVLDLLGRLRWPEATRLADRAVQRGWIRPGDVADRVRRHPGRTGNRQLRALEPFVTDGAAAQSERILHALLRRAGLQGWKPNLDVWHHGELVAVLDVGFPERRVAVEVDGMAFHVDVDSFRRDRSRQNRLVALGWTVLRFTWADLTERPDHVVATIRQLVA